MPKIPIDFTYGYYEDAALKSANREVLNCYPETTQGDNQRTVLRTVENYQTREDTSTRSYGNSIMVGDVIYGVEAGGQFFSIDVGTNTYTVIGNLPSAIYIPYRMATNGDTIVMVNFQSGTVTNDFYYDTSSGTLDRITNKDAVYGGFSKARDVVYKDGYYLFITDDGLFHGDNFLSTGDGLVFNALSFAPLPAESGDGVGLEVANSQVYAFASNSTLLYQTAPTTPFSFARNTGFDLELGLTDPSMKVTFDDRIFLLGKASGSGASAYVLSGQSFENVSNTELDEDLKNISYRAVVSTYVANGHRMITMRPHLSQGTSVDPVVLDFTETQIKGFPVWHRRAFQSAGVWPIFEYFNTKQSTGTLDSTGFAMGIRNSGFRGTTLYQVKPTEVIGEPSEFDMPGIDRYFEYTFPALRNDAEPFFIKSIRLMWTDNIKEVELFVTEDNSTYTSLGEFDLEATTEKQAEWRRINRFSNQAGFKVRFQTVNSTDNTVLITGNYMT